MSDRVVESEMNEVPEIPELVEQLGLTVLEDGKSMMEQGGEVCPFTALLVKDNLFMESHPGSCAEECYALAQHTVEGARGASGYAFCYDGYVDTDDGMKDVLIAEVGLPGEDEGFAIGFLYEAAEDGSVTFEEEPAYIGPCPNFMSKLKEAIDYGEDEIDSKYISGDDAALEE